MTLWNPQTLYPYRDITDREEDGAKLAIGTYYI